MSGTDILETPLTAGQNEGIERSILPLPQLASVVNARQRKGGRWGKRYGTGSLGAVNQSNMPLGNGTANSRCIGPGFVIVDDQCAVFDQQGQKWVDPKLLQAANTTSPICQSPRVAGAVSGWLTGTAYFPVPAATQQYQQLTPCAQTYGLGYAWSAVQYLDPSNLASQDGIVRVTATNPTDQSLVFLQDFTAGSAAQGGNIYPKLITCGSTIVLTYVTRPNNAAAIVAGRKLTTIAAGFGAETSIVAFGAPGNVYDATAYSATLFLLAVGTAGVTTPSIVTLSTFAVASQAGPAVTAIGLNIVSTPGVPVYLVTSSAGATTVSVYANGLGALVGTVTLDATEPATYTAYATLLPGGGVRVAYGYFDDAGAVPRHFSWRDVTAAAALASGLIGRQYRFKPISRPFTVGTQVYIWTATPDVASGFGYATLLRLPALIEYKALAGTVNSLSCPLEMSAQDFLVRSAKPTIYQLGSTGIIGVGVAEQPNGLPLPIQLGTTATYSFLVPIFLSVPDLLVPNGVEFRAIQVTHYSTTPSARSVNSVSAGRADFLPLGALTRIDQRGAAEAGFVSTTGILGAITKSGAAGAMSPSVTYKYVALYKSRNEAGQFEVSAVSAVSSITMGAGDSETFFNLLTLSVTARPNVQIEVYRTLGNGSIFYFVSSISGGASDGATVAYNDQLGDSVISAHSVLYTQVGQTLPNALPPPARIAVTGGQRVFLAGLLRSDVVHCSKFILGDQSPSWADSDSFRIIVPGTVTGLAWMDNLVIFTDEGVYVVSGDGPDDSGNGEFSAPIRLPIAFGCIEPRSVFTVAEGAFFQATRGLYMLPRGFSAPIPAGDAVLDTLANFPIITSAASLIKLKEHTVRWSCMDNATNTGRQLVYDVVHQCWSVDSVTSFTGIVDFGLVSIAPWVNGEIAMIGPALVLIVSAATFDDNGIVIAMRLATGDIRPFGNMSEGVISRVYLMAELRALCTLGTTKTTEWASSPQSNRVFAAVAGDTQVGQITYVETDLGNAELRDAVSLSVQWDESSALEGLAFIAIAIEHEQGEGLKRVGPLARGT